jgi:hypothetical protein
MQTLEELSDEDCAILAFVKRHFEENDMRDAVRLLDLLTIEETRQVIEGYRAIYRREGRH